MIESYLILFSLFMLVHQICHQPFQTLSHQLFVLVRDRSILKLLLRCGIDPVVDDLSLDSCLADILNFFGHFAKITESLHSYEGWRKKLPMSVESSLVLADNLWTVVVLEPSVEHLLLCLDLLVLASELQDFTLFHLEFSQDVKSSQSSELLESINSLQDAFLNTLHIDSTLFPHIKHSSNSLLRSLLNRLYQSKSQDLLLSDWVPQVIKHLLLESQKLHVLKLPDVLLYLNVFN